MQHSNYDYELMLTLLSEMEQQPIFFKLRWKLKKQPPLNRACPIKMMLMLTSFIAPNIVYLLCLLKSMTEGLNKVT